MEPFFIRVDLTLPTRNPALRNNETDARGNLQFRRPHRAKIPSRANKKLRSCLQFERLGGFFRVFLPKISRLTRKIATFGFETRNPGPVTRNQFNNRTMEPFFIRVDSTLLLLPLPFS